MSPWLLFDSEAPSYFDNGLDILTPLLLKYWADCFRQGTSIENNKAELNGSAGSAGYYYYWAEPGKAPADWWHGSENVVSKILLTSGAWEIMNDDIQRFGEVLKDATSTNTINGAYGQLNVAEVITEVAGMHIGPTIDSAFLRPPTEFTKVITGWVYDRLAA